MGEARRKRMLAQDRAFHFTTLLHLPWIIAGDGAIAPSRHIQRAPGLRGVAWCGFRPMAGSLTAPLRQHNWTHACGRASRCRWRRRWLWRDACRAAGWTDEDIGLAEHLTLRYGVATEAWRATIDPYPLPRGPGGVFLASADTAWLEVFCGGRWGQFSVELALAPDHESGVVGRDGIYIERPDGAYGYAARMPESATH